jgi:[ribosomal protein S18]-alanine N-acetyltransferase
MRRTAVRPAAPADLDAAAALAASRSATKWTRAALADELGRSDAVFLVATILGDGRIQGYAAARLVDEELRLLDIVSAADGEGTGRELWDALVTEGRRRGAKKLTLEVSECNARAIRFYGAAGAVVVGKRPKFYADGSGAVLMDRELTPE